MDRSQLLNFSFEEAGLPVYGHYIAGKMRKPSSNAYFETEDPTFGTPWARIARGNSSDVDDAVAAARQAFGSWAGLKPSERGRYLHRLAAIIDEHAARLATIEVRDNGKLYAEMHAQARYIAQWYRYYGGLADKIAGQVIPTDKSEIFNYTRYEPLGVIGMITPWNSPLLLLTWKLAAALAAGNTVVAKPSEFTSVSTLEFARLVEMAGFPSGVFNVVTGYGLEVGERLVEHPDIAKIAFTGSDASGQKIYESAARTIKHVTLELGGKSPNIVFSDADMEAAQNGVISGILAAGGQTCIAGSRLLLQRDIHDAFIETFLDRIARVRIGNPMEASTNMGPVATRPQLGKVLDYIDVARADGATCTYGGSRYDGPGATSDMFVMPTVFTGVRNDMRIAREEVFGPVLSVIPFDDEEEAFAIANDSAFGLGAGLWTNDIRKAIEGSARIQAGTVWVNTYRALSYTSPFGGYKRSGIGREGGTEAIKEYLQTKSVWICTRPEVENPFIMR